jgi:CxxC motif-containing protein (DUF1111 family)
MRLAEKMSPRQIRSYLENLNISLRSKLILGSSILLFLSLTSVIATQGQNPAHDPGPRGAPVSAGQPLTGLTTNQLQFFNDGADNFNEPQTLAQGLGPTYNSNSCGSCHSQPALGGSSPNLNAYPNVGQNPQVPVANFDGTTNTVPFFVTLDGPVREARFKFNTVNGNVNPSSPDGGVHDLYTIQGDPGAPGCNLAQPDFVTANAQHNLIFRIPTPVFGAGLIENIPESTIIANQLANSTVKQAFGIFGHANRMIGVSGEANHSGNDGTITRFGWKAQNKSLLIFAGEAYNVEVGETNELFPNERGNPPAACLVNPQPEDGTNFDNSGDAILSDVDQFAIFMKFLDQPTPACTGTACSPSIQNGIKLFTSTGCAMCHTPTLATGPSSITPGLNNVNANLFSDLLVHHMGSGLADGVSQGNAGPDEFRSAPLWGLGQRVFFLHDGRTNDLLQAIQAHASEGSEANQVIHKYNNLTPSQKQDLINFLRSL